MNGYGPGFSDETWDEFADHQLDHDPTPAQDALLLARAELDLFACQHPYISWHGSRGECQDCGRNVATPVEYRVVRTYREARQVQPRRIGLVCGE